MTIVRTEPGVPAGAPDRVTFQVSAIGSTDAAYQAKLEARAAGYRVRTMGRMELAVGQTYIDEHHDRLDWNVELVVRRSA